MASRLGTESNLLAMPDDGVRRWIIKGQLREEPSEYPEVARSVRSRSRCHCTALIATAVALWTRSRPKPRGAVYSGEVGVAIAPGTLVGAHVAYAPPGVVAAQDDDKTTMLDGRRSSSRSCRRPPRRSNSTRRSTPTSKPPCRPCGSSTRRGARSWSTARGTNRNCSTLPTACHRTPRCPGSPPPCWNCSSDTAVSLRRLRRDVPEHVAALGPGPPVEAERHRRERERQHHRRHLPEQEV